MEILLRIILNPYFLMPAALTSILPLRWVLRFWIFVAIIGFGFSAFQTQTSISNDPGIGYILGIAILIFYGIFLYFIVIAKLIIQRIRKKESKVYPLESKALHIVDSFLFLMTGTVLSILTFKFLAFSLAAFSHGFLIHGGISLTLIILIGAVLKFNPHDKKYFYSRTSILALSLLCALLLFSSMGSFYPYVVIQSAQRIAAKNPHCIGLNTRARPLNSLEDLTLLTMDKSNFEHHAVLLVEKEDSTLEPYHWSYFQSDFLPGIGNWTNDSRPSIPCRPARNFIEETPLISNKVTRDIEFYFHGHFLKIPEEYSPFVSNNYISIAVQAPNFKAVPRESGHLYANMEMGSKEWMEALHKNYESLPPTGKIGNLSEIENAAAHIDWYYRFNDDHQLVTVAGCYSAGRPSETACQHRFYREGAMYTFDHNKELLSQSNEMERKLFDLFQSFKEK